MDSYLLHWYRSITAGTAWYDIATDVAYLGTYPVLGLLIIFIIGYLYLQKEYQKAMIVVAYTFTAGAVFEAVHLGFNVPKATETCVQLILNGHSMLTMTVYLIVAQAMPIGHRRFLIIYAVCIALLVGICRAIIGIHYTTDVIIGWVISGAIGYAYSYSNRWVEKVNPPKRRATDDVSPLSDSGGIPILFHNPYNQKESE